MGACTTKADPSVADSELPKRRDPQVDALQKQLKALFHYKIILLGTEESGKTTLVKQVKLAHNMRVSPPELAVIVDGLHRNVLSCIRALIEAAMQFNEMWADSEDAAAARHLMNENVKEGYRISEGLGKTISRLAQSEAIKRTYERRNQFWLLDSCAYYLANVQRFTQRQGFEPTEEDCLMAMVPTVGVVKHTFEQKLQDFEEGDPRNVTFEVWDLGGKRSERAKWTRHFEEAKCALYVVNLAGYNEICQEDAKMNRLEDAVQLFAEVANELVMGRVPITLVLNKCDLMEPKLKQHGLVETFPKYTGQICECCRGFREGTEVDFALAYVESLFRKVMPEGAALTVKIISALSQEEVQVMFDSVKSTLYHASKTSIAQEKRDLKKQIARAQKAAQKSR
jgi:GTPase SAR1 family protein